MITAYALMLSPLAAWRAFARTQPGFADRQPRVRITVECGKSGRVIPPFSAMPFNCSSVEGSTSSSATIPLGNTVFRPAGMNGCQLAGSK